MFLLETSACTDASFLATILFIKKIIKILSIIVPAILILLLSIDFAKAVISSDDSQMKKAQSLAIKRIIYALIVFFVPMIVDVSFNLIGDKGNSVFSCYSNANDDEIAKILEDKRHDKENENEKQKEKIAKLIKNRKEEVEKARIEASKRKSTSSSDGSSDLSINASSWSEQIALTAKALASPKKAKKSEYYYFYCSSKKKAPNKYYTKWSSMPKKPLKVYMDAMDKAYPDHFKWSTGYPCIRHGQSCDTFVSVVVAASGYDKLGKHRGNIETNLKNKKKWKKVSSAKPGDICLDSGHTKLYLGKNRIAQASYGSLYGHITSGNCNNSVSIWRAIKEKK